MKIELFLKMAHELNVTHFPQGVRIGRHTDGSYEVHICHRDGGIREPFVRGQKSYDAAWDAACSKMIETANQKAQQAEREAMDAKSRAARVMSLVEA